MMQRDQIKTKTDFLQISDLHLAVFLKTKYHLKIVDMKRDKGRITFVFNTNGLSGQDLIRNFYNGDDTVRANDFVRELKDMKALVHNV